MEAWNCNFQRFSLNWTNRTAFHCFYRKSFVLGLKAVFYFYFWHTLERFDKTNVHFSFVEKTNFETNFNLKVQLNCNRSTVCCPTMGKLDYFDFFRFISINKSLIWLAIQILYYYGYLSVWFIHLEAKFSIQNEKKTSFSV